ncbi:MAG: bifunctional phosphoribosyl-AMP cyclohydrolase/phosphoribosyl-ATP diphosphatase HisIE [Lachnospiraceae bacterium]|nr:bifunctional phosphoribosyl-AMP cyclohydrolase/phosphoribosyl-ATP diphosphatase HisIE [Lachnospiraceae bacterium]
MNGLIAKIYIKNGMAVLSPDSLEALDISPVTLALSAAEHGAHALYIGDLADTDEEHEKNLTILREICSASEVPVIGAEYYFLTRMEDVKKQLYAGCKHVVLDGDCSDSAAVLKEVSQKFGRDKIFVRAYDPSMPKGTTLEDITRYACEVLDLSDMERFADAYQLIQSEKMDSGNALEAAFNWADFKKDPQGLVPVIVQDYKTSQVLMAAYMNEQAYLDTLKTGKMNYYSRSRQTQWLKGETSGHYQYVKSLTADCDMDTILATVRQVGAACHTGSYSCFFNEITPKQYDEKNPLQVFEDVYAVIQDRKVNPKEGSYTNYLFDKGIDKILKKVGEEATEIVIAAKNPNPEETKYEIADFLYHVMVLMAEKGVTWEDITTELANR